jgi:hypothetical protein
MACAGFGLPVVQARFPLEAKSLSTTSKSPRFGGAFFWQPHGARPRGIGRMAWEGRSIAGPEIQTGNGPRNSNRGPKRENPAGAGSSLGRKYSDRSERYIAKESPPVVTKISHPHPKMARRTPEVMHVGYDGSPLGQRPWLPGHTRTTRRDHPQPLNQKYLGLSSAVQISAATDGR